MTDTPRGTMAEGYTDPVVREENLRIAEGDARTAEELAAILRDAAMHYHDGPCGDAVDALNDLIDLLEAAKRQRADAEQEFRACRAELWRVARERDWLANILSARYGTPNEWREAAKEATR